jgi:hypothetical protein
LKIQKVPSGLSISDYRRKGLRYFRGDRGREPSSRCDAVDVRQIDLHLAQGFGGKRFGGERQGVRSEWYRIKGFFGIVWWGAQMSGVDHGVLLWMFGAEHKTAKVCPTAERPTNDLATLGGI